MYGQKDHLCVEIVFPELPDSLDAAEDRHRDVDDQKIGFEPLRSLKERLPISHRPNHFELVFQQAPNSIKHRFCVISQ